MMCREVMINGFVAIDLSKDAYGMAQWIHIADTNWFGMKL